MIDYLDWESELTLDRVFACADTYSFPHIVGEAENQQGVFLYLTTLKSEKSRAVLMLRTGDDTQCITPAPFSLRTSVNEYGGKPFWLFGDELLFANQKDQCLYRQTIADGVASRPEKITNADPSAVRMYTDLVKVATDTYLAILEHEQDQGQENAMCIALLNAGELDSEPQVLSLGADFYSNLVYHPETGKIAWVQWNHPNMPWDETELWVANLTLFDGGKLPGVQASLTQSERVSLAPGASVCQLLFASNGRLFFSADYPSLGGNSDFWNIHCLEPDSLQVTSVTDVDLEFGYPHWVYGDARIVQLTDDSLVAVGSRPTGDSLFLINQESLNVTKLHSFDGTIQHLHSDGSGTLIVERMARDAAPCLAIASLGNNRSFSGFLALTRSDTPLEEVSQAEHFHYVGRDGGNVYGFFYPPQNEACQLKTNVDTKPPLIVMVHGGPTARAYGHFDIQKQFWTSRGFALFDVNHRGSSGYGRRYRDALYDQWGKLDTSDIIEGISALVKAGRVDPKRVCIRGKSAGGYAVLRALTEYPNQFKAGACYYGIGNLVTLAETTHKFEKYYTDRLIGEKFAAESAREESSRFVQRSPIHKMNQVTSAMIVFQGLLDKVVPPSVAQEVIDVLKSADVEHSYVEYDDEGHGFRMVDNNIDAWSKELAFYRKVLR